jgi:putative ABC transport system permease protein
MRVTWPNGEQIEGTQPLVRTGFHAVDTLGLKLLAGRDFSPEFSSDWYTEDKEGNKTVSVIVTRRLAELAGYQDLQSIVGVTVTEPLRKLTGKIVGVVENVKIGSARQLALPVSFHLGSNRNIGHIVIKVANTDLTKLSREIQKIVSKQLNLSNVEVTRLSDDYANAHKNELQALKMVEIFSFLAIFLTCLGTFGLASFAILGRQKEVAIRKVLGASRLSLVNLLAKEFLLLVAISIVIAYPLSYWLIGEWLANFNERIEQTVWVYLVAAAFISMLTWLTVASLAFKAASSRPSLILRDE